MDFGEHETALDATNLKFLALLAALEEVFPGFSDLVVKHVEDESLHLEVRRLGKAGPDPHLVAEARKAMTDMRALRFVTKAHAIPRKRGKARV